MRKVKTRYGAIKGVKLTSLFERTIRAMSATEDDKKKYNAEDGRCQLQKYLDENYLDLIRNIYLVWDRGTLLVTKGTSPRITRKVYYGKRKKE